MARQRVVFISGVGELIPGQVSSLKDAGTYVKNGLAGIVSGNPATKTSFGSLINPGVNAGSQLLKNSGALKSGLGALGLPQNAGNFVSSAVNTGGSFVQLFLNPQRIKETKRKIITEVPTASGFANLHWGMALDRIRFELISRNERGSETSTAVQNTADLAKENMDQLERFFEVNNFNTGLIYRNKIYVGHFEGEFGRSRDISMPGIEKVDLMFVVDKKPSVSLPGLGVFNINQVPFSI